jgi:hypothetical protein
LEEDRQSGDDQPDDGQHQEGPRRGDALGALAPADEDRGDGCDCDRKRDRPAEVGGVRAGERGEGDRAERVGAGAEPGKGAHAERDERSDPGGEQAGDQHELELGAAEPGRLDHDDGGDQGRIEQERDRGEGAGGGDHREHLRRHVSAREPHRHERETGAESDQRRLRAEHDPQADRGEGRERDPGQVDRRDGGAAGDEAVGWDVPAFAGEAGDRERGDQTGDREHWKRPPGERPGVVAEIAGEVDEHTLLDRVDELEKTPCPERDDETDDCGDHEQDDEPTTLDRRVDLLGGKLRGRLGVRHDEIPRASLDRLYEPVSTSPAVSTS